MIRSEFKTEKVTEHITRIYAFCSEQMYLVEGKERAALLDSGSGIGSVRPLIARLTVRPVTVLLTHGHVDHAMGASEFPAEDVYINQEDAYIYRKHCTLEFRRKSLWMQETDDLVTDEDFTPMVPIESWHDLKEGDFFDLGGISVEIHACPGHTRGSLVMLIPEERTVLLGDACSHSTFLFQDYSTSLEEYRVSLSRLREKLESRFDMALSSHGSGMLAKDVVDDNLSLCEQILAGEIHGFPMELRGTMALRARKHVSQGHGNIFYNPARIYRSGSV
ncbi:MAG: MBL fold metallo-hydrolase [Lachnospiraceae bacterium]|nr:MBL fold metallo-hydrolase [Lachnospiraceae bacterium]